MRNRKSAKTKSALKRWLRIAGLFIASLVFIGIVSGIAVAANARLLRADGNIYRLRVANTDDERMLGLSGVETMADSKGMLFVFDEPEAACFWMKDMNFALDIIWLNSDKEVMQVAKDVRPRTYPRTFCPSTEARYVIELASGQSDIANIAVGQKLSF